MSDNPFRKLPAVSKVLDHPTILSLLTDHDTDTLTEAVRVELDDVRSTILANPAVEIATLDTIAQRVTARLAHAAKSRIRTVINATGIVLHTNLGRSPLHEEAAQAAYEAARGYLNLELDLDTGNRSSRQNNVRDGICHITGAESATAVNNCAAATVIVLRALADGKEVIVSRGQLIEIGGSFRIPDIMTVSGATLRAVGTTNITRISDYENAIGPNTGLLMRIHTSNYRVRGFTKTVGIEELVALGKRHNIPVVDDAGSGAIIDFAKYGLPGEPNVAEGIRAGADLVLFSGDKLLGGPQAGLIAGKSSHINKIEKDPLMRAFRLDKMTIAALEATLRFYRDPGKATTALPTLRMLTMPLTELRERSERFAIQLRAMPELTVDVKDDVAFVGGGSLPDQALPTVVIAISATTRSEADLATRLRTGITAVVGRTQDSKLLLDLRTVFVRQEPELLAAIQAAIL